MADIARIVALGASNLTRGFRTVISAARSAFGPEVQVLAALGYGRSYGASSSVLFRTLPGILESGLWRTLESLPQVPTRAIVTDIGNDILYGYSAEQTLDWVEEAVNRLQRVTRDIILTDLPYANIQQLSLGRYLIFRSILFPSCPLSLSQVLEKVGRINAGLAELAAARGLKFFRLDPSWYGLDPIHIRPSRWRSAWREILHVRSGASAEGGSLLEGWRLYLMASERRWLFGVEQFTPQRGVMLPKGGRVWLY
jgi:hypothetical protein